MDASLERPKFLSIEGIFLDPVKTAVDQEELVAVYDFELHVNLMAVQSPSRANWSGEGCSNARLDLAFLSWLRVSSKSWRPS